MAEATSEEQQMKMAFMDDGMERDPVSGNDIPTGSLAEEVRDDVPAMLSEGEYVVPADVLRFYGIKFFEDLRIKAKDGLAQMESMGRIGGQPVEEEGEPSNVLPFPVEELETEEEEIEMAVGGYVGYDEGGAELGMQHMFLHNPEMGTYRILPAGMVGRSPGDVEITEAEYRAALGDELADTRIAEANARFNNNNQNSNNNNNEKEEEPNITSGTPNWVNSPSGSGPFMMVVTPLTNPITGEVFNAPNSGYSVKSEEEIKALMTQEEKDKEEKTEDKKEGQEDSSSSESGFRQVQYWNGQDESTIFTATFIGDVPISHSSTQLAKYVQYIPQADDGEGDDEGDSSTFKKKKDDMSGTQTFKEMHEKQEEITKKLYPEGFGSERIARTEDEIFDYAKQLKGFGPMNIGIDDIITKIPGIGNLTSGLLAKQHKDILEDAKEIYDDPEAYNNLSDERKIILDNLVAGAEGYTPGRSFAHQGLDAFGKLFSPTSSKKPNTGSSSISSSDYDEARRKKRKDKRRQDRIDKDTSGKLAAQDKIKKAADKAGISTGTGKDKVYTGGGKHGGFNKGGLMRKGKK